MEFRLWDIFKNYHHAISFTALPRNFSPLSSLFAILTFEHLHIFNTKKKYLLYVVSISFVQITTTMWFPNAMNRLQLYRDQAIQFVLWSKINALPSFRRSLIVFFIMRISIAKHFIWYDCTYIMIERVLTLNIQAKNTMLCVMTKWLECEPTLNKSTKVHISIQLVFEQIRER